MEGRIARRAELRAAVGRTAEASIIHGLACMQCRHDGHPEMCDTGKALDAAWETALDAAWETALDAYENEVGDVIR